MSVAAYGDDDGSGSTGSRCCRLLGHTTCGLSSTYCTMTGKARSFCPAMAPSPRNFTPKPSIVPPSGMSTSSAALRSASASMPPCFLIARGSTSLMKTYVLLADMPTCADFTWVPGRALSYSSPTILISGTSSGLSAFSLASQIEIGSTLKKWFTSLPIASFSLS